MREKTKLMDYKISRHFYKDVIIHAMLDENKRKWLFSCLDVIGALLDEPSSFKRRQIWNSLKLKLAKELVSDTNQLKIKAQNGKYYLSDTLDEKGAIKLAKLFPDKISHDFIAWFVQYASSVDAKSKLKAYDLFDSGKLKHIKVGTIKGLMDIHSFLFNGLYSFAGQIRTLNISKGGFMFAPAMYLYKTLLTIEKMPEDNFEEIIDKYVETNVAHPFMDGNGRSMRIWLDLILKKHLSKCIDWSKVDKRKYLDAMKESIADATRIKDLLKKALTTKINDRDLFMKGIDYSYYYEQE